MHSMESGGVTVLCVIGHAERVYLLKDGVALSVSRLLFYFYNVFPLSFFSSFPFGEISESLVMSV